MEDVFRTLFEYNHALGQRLWESLMHLSDEQFVQPVDYSHGSLRNQVVHLCVTETRWLRGLKGIPDARAYQLDPQDFPTRQSALVLWEATEKELMAYIDTLDEARLRQVPPRMSEPAWQVLAHLVNHGTDHRAQLLRLLHDLGVKTVSQDYIFYVYEHP